MVLGLIGTSRLELLHPGLTPTDFSLLIGTSNKFVDGVGQTYIFTLLVGVILTGLEPVSPWMLPSNAKGVSAQILV